MADGTITLTVTHTDLVNNDNAVDGTDVIIKDTILPATPTVTINGSTTINGATNLASIPITITGTGVNTYTYTIDTTGSAEFTSGGGTLTGGSANFNVDLTSANGDLTVDLADGDITLTVTHTDLVGNDNATDGTDNVLKDTQSATPPTAVTFTPVGPVIVANTLNLTNTNFTAQATIIAAEATGGSAELLKDGASFPVPILDTSIGGADVTVTFDPGLLSNAAVQTAFAIGATLSVRLTDGVGNTSLSTVSNPAITVDYSAPAQPTVTINGGNPINTSTNLASIPITISGEGSNNYTYDIITSGSGESTSGAGSLTGGTANFNVDLTSANGDLTVDIADGTITLTVTETDLAGNVNTADGTDAVIKDTGLPITPTVTINSGNPINAATNLANIPITVTGTDAYTYTYTIDSSGDAQSVTGGGTLSSGFDSFNVDLTSAHAQLTTNLADGTITLTVTHTDLVNNDNAVDGTDVIIKDTILPATPTVTINGSTTINGATNLASIPITITGTGVNTYTYTIDTTGSAEFTSGGGTLTGGSANFNVDLTSANGDLTVDLADGDITLTVTHTDLVGNDNATDGTDNVLKDTQSATPPTAVTFTPVGPVIVANTLNLTNTNFTAQATIIAAEATGGSAELLKDGASFPVPILDTSIGGADVTVTFDPGLLSNAAVQTAFAIGATLSVRLTDGVGNPVVSIVGNPFITVDYVAPNVSLVTLTPNSGTLKIDGTVTITATEGSSETGLIASNASFNAQSIALVDQTDGTYQGTYTILSGHNDITNPQATGITLTDSAGNISTVASSAVSALIIDANIPVITSITSDAISGGILKVLDTVLFTLTPALTEVNATVAGSYNSTVLSWSTADGGDTYTAVLHCYRR